MVPQDPTQSQLQALKAIARMYVNSTMPATKFKITRDDTADPSAQSKDAVGECSNEGHPKPHPDAFSS